MCVACLLHIHLVFVCECLCVLVPEQMFLIKHIVSQVRPSIMNSSSVGERAAVEGIMGNWSSVLQKEEAADGINEGERCG